ncbi:hypothetical protein BGY98DRAFT_942766 [Russula aff. rugulosa BPL654]|nr:hypothetical protein BGY98DRAFT_942766 [Russula aff. rugulosa BPL654]
MLPPLSSKASRNPLLHVYLTQLTEHPLRTKALTSATLCFLQEVLSSHLAGVPARRQPARGAPLYSHVLARTKVTMRAVKIALYGLLVSGPLSHVLVGKLQKAFAGKTDAFFYLFSLSVINGAKSWNDVKTALVDSFFPVMKVVWLSTPPSIFFAQNFLSPEQWSPFFNIVAIIIGTYYNTKLKKLRRTAEKKDGDKKQ